MTTDDQRRIQALLAERSTLIAQRDRYAQDLADLLRPGRAVRVAAHGTVLPRGVRPGGDRRVAR